MTNETKLTDEQVRWLAELFGVQIIEGEWYFDKMPKSPFRTRFLLSGPDDYIDIFLSAEGEKAVMNRAVEEGYRHFLFWVQESGNWYVEVGKTDARFDFATGPTPFIAFLNALMEAEGWNVQDAES